MARRHEWDGEIDNLPPEALSYNIKEIPRPTLKEIANLLNAESVSAGNWESLAEKLGFTQNSVLDTLMQQARVQNTFPGLLMLQEWSRRAGSTAHVLLHALREIQREDAVRVLVDKLYDLHTMQLLVSIQEGEGSPRFLRVPTQKSAPLHASLDNTLHKPLYWYDIVGPSYNINWNTMSGQLQGTQLSLRLRVEPSEASISEIYGTTARLRHPPPNIPPDIPLGMNIPPEKHLPCSEGQGTMNDLSSSQLSHPGLSDKLSHTPPVFRFPPQPCGPLAQQQHSQDSALCGFEPMTSLGPPHSHFLQQFPNIDTLMSVSNLVLPGPPVSVSSLMDSAEDMQFDPSSCTELKEVLPPFSVGDHQDTLLKERVRSEQEKGNFASADQRKPLCEGDMNIRPMTPEEMAFVEGSQLTETSGPSTTASSLMHPVYVDHDRLIHFYNNPTSPQSLGSNCSSLSSTGTADLSPQTVDPSCGAAQQHNTSPDDFRRMANAGGYVPLKFIELQSQNIGKNPALDRNEEERMQTESSDSEHTRAKRSRDEGNSSQQGTGSDFSPAASTPVYSNVDSRCRPKPTPCTYTMYRPGAMNSQQCADFQPRFLPHSVSLDSDGYMDMNGTARCPTTTTTTTSSMMTGIHTCMSVDSYMNTQVSEFNLHNASSSRLLDSGGRNLSMPNPDPMLHSRSRHPLPASGDVFPPRDRRPLTQDHELLLDKPEPEPEYTYIDAVSPPPDLPRRSSDGALLASRGRRHGTADDDLGRRNSDVKLEHQGSVSPSELQQVPGWSARVTERTVDHEMSRYINDDGNFIVWWYEVGRKYVISVSHLRSIRHYAVYESEREGKVWYYIFPKGARFTSLAALILHCQKHGVAEPTKTFKTPDGREAHRSSSGTSGRFSHVRLKYPIPARRN